MRTITLKVPSDLDRALTDLARGEGTTRSPLIRRALTRLLGPSPLSFGALAGDLAGALEGPYDLSSSPGHMAEYGR